MTTMGGFDQVPLGRRWLGFGFALTAAFCYSTGTIFASTVFESGANAQTLVTVRASIVLPAILLYAALAGRAIMLPKRERTFALALGVITAFQQLSFYMSIERIPVSLAILCEYLYPMIVLISMRILFGETLTALKIGCIVAATAGVAIALQVDMDKLNLWGVLFAFGSAIGASIRLISNGLLLRSADPIKLMVHMLVGILVVFWPLFGALDLLHFPETEKGYAALFGMAVLNGAGTILALTALKIIGPVRTAVAQTGEPLFTMAMAVVLLGEILTFQRALGALLVIGALFTLQIARARRAGAA